MTDPLFDALDELAAMGTDHGRALQASVVATLWRESYADYLAMKQDAEAWRLAQEGLAKGKAEEQRRRDEAGAPQDPHTESPGWADR